MKILSLLLSIGVMTSNIAFASGGISVAGGGGDRLNPAIDNQHPPIPIANMPDEDIKALHFAQLRTNWEQGTLLSENILSGSWKLMADGLNPLCGAEYDRYNFRGIKNSDGSTLSLEFKQTPDSKIFVSVLNYIRANFNMGASKIDPAQPSFSHWSYIYYLIANETAKPKLALVANGITQYVCRGLSGDKEKMICALTYAPLPGAKPVAADALCQGAGISSIFVYIKIPSSLQK